MNTLALMILTMSTPLAQAKTNLTVEAYTASVLGAQPMLDAQRDQVKAAELDERKIDVMTSTQLNTTVSSINDRRPPLSLAPGYSSLTGTSIKTDVSRQFNTGTTAKVAVDLQSITFNAFRLSPQEAGRKQEINTLLPSIEISQPLWKGAGGRSIKQQRDSLSLQTLAQGETFKVRTKEAVLDAELTYFRLAFARDRVEIAKTTLATAEKILDFVKSKQSQNLYEKGDFLQAKALVEVRRLELQESLSEQRSASLAFNTARSILSDVVSEDLASLRSSVIAEETPGIDINKQPELHVLRNQVELSQVAISTSEESNLPQINAFANYGLQSRYDNLSQTMRSVLDPYHPVLTVGLTLQMTLDRDLIKSQTDAARLRRRAAQSQYDDLDRRLKRAAQDLTVHRSEAVNIYKMSKSLEEVQAEKLKNEQNQHRNGRSTTYQLLMFSQDLAQAELGRVKAAYSVHMIDAQLRQFRGETK
ncbi:MAG: TolC family protein [Proteobacteria bacterium]|nr:TolC family protein [Pseudomonadota bacterium]